MIDTRNDYEVAIGSFEGAVDPGTASFRDFPAWWEANSDRFEGKRIAMFCTGGIRCEKSTNWLIGQGVEDVYHLQGGILKYLEEVPEGRQRYGRANASSSTAGSASATDCARGRTCCATPAAARSCPRTATARRTRRAWPATIASTRPRRPTRPGSANASGRSRWPAARGDRHMVAQG